MSVEGKGGRREGPDACVYDATSGATLWERQEASTEVLHVLASPDGTAACVVGTDFDMGDYFSAAYEA